MPLSSQTTSLESSLYGQTHRTQQRKERAKEEDKLRRFKDMSLKRAHSRDKNSRSVIDEQSTEEDTRSICKNRHHEKESHRI